MSLVERTLSVRCGNVGCLKRKFYVYRRMDGTGVDLVCCDCGQAAALDNK